MFKTVSQQMLENENYELKLLNGRIEDTKDREIAQLKHAHKLEIEDIKHLTKMTIEKSALEKDTAHMKIVDQMSRQYYEGQAKSSDAMLARILEHLPNYNIKKVE